jgi:hypothetical protein
MKRVVVVGLLVLALCVPAVFAEQKGTSVTFNPVGFLFGQLVEVNLGVTPSLSVPVGGSYLGYKTGDDEFSFTRFGGGLRYYWAGNGVNGWYIGGLLTYNTISVETTANQLVGGTIVKYTGSASASAVGYGALIGYQSIWGNGFTLDTGIGIQQLTTPDIDVEVKNSVGAKMTETVEGVSVSLPIIQLALGYAF